MPTKAVSYRVQEATAERIEKLRDRFDHSRTKVIDDAVYNLALQEGILDEEARERFDAIVSRHGDDAIITFAVVPNNAAVPVSINGNPTQEIRAHRMFVAAYFVESGRPQIDVNAEHPTIAVIPNSGIIFDLGRAPAPHKLEMKLSELFGRMKPFQPRTSSGALMNREIRRSAGYEPDDEDGVES